MSKKKKKVRVNITVDKDILDTAKNKLNLFGGKLSTLFNAYLSDFANSIDKAPSKTHEELLKRIKNLEYKVRKLEEKS